MTVAKGFTSYMVWTTLRHSLVAELNSARLILVLAANRDWTVDKMDVKNAFLHLDFQEEV